MGVSFTGIPHCLCNQMSIDEHKKTVVVERNLECFKAIES